jgi:large subunit ribosomal protein L18
MEKAKAKNIQRSRRKARIRAKVSGTPECPRFSVFRSNRYIYAQLIDDAGGRTLAAVHSREIKDKKSSAEEKFTAEIELGKLLAEKGMAKKIKRVVFDRGGYKYHGRIKAVAEGARTAGLEF